MNTITSSLLAAVVLAGAGVAFQYLRSASETTSNANAVRTVAFDSKNEVAEVTAKIVKIRRVEQQPGSAGSVAVPENRSDQALDPDPDAKDQNLLEHAFTQEDYDPSWSAVTENSLTEIIKTGIGEGSHLHGVVCRETVCRLELQHRDLQSELQFLAAFAQTGQFTNDGKQGSYASTPQIDGTVVAEFYYGRTSS